MVARFGKPIPMVMSVGDPGARLSLLTAIAIPI
jgi:hypothetical protein